MHTNFIKHCSNISILIVTNFILFCNTVTWIRIFIFICFKYSKQVTKQIKRVTNCNLVASLMQWRLRLRSETLLWVGGGLIRKM